MVLKLVNSIIKVTNARVGLLYCSVNIWQCVGRFLCYFHFEIFENDIKAKQYSACGRCTSWCGA